MLPSLSELLVDRLEQLKSSQTRLWRRWCQNRFYQLMDSEEISRPKVSIRGSKSLGSEDMGYSGEFRQASTQASTVHNFSYVRRVSPIMCRRCRLADLTAPSHNPPKCGACGGINRHSTPFAIAWWQIDFSFFLRNSTRFIPRAQWKVGPIIWAGLPISTSTCEKSI